MATLKITKKHHRHINNPFPSTPRSLPFVQGALSFNPQTFPSQQIFCIGKEFQLIWKSKNGDGCVSICHQSQPSKAIWSTIPGKAFLSAALVETEVEESRGSFVIKDRDVHLVCNHQTIEDIRVIHHLSDYNKREHDDDFSSGFLGLNQKIKLEDTQFPVLLITGRISSVNSRDVKNHKSEVEGNEPSISARYWVLFDQKNSDQIGFQVKLGKPNFEFNQRICPRTYGACRGYLPRLGQILRRQRLGWSGCFPKRRVNAIAAPTNEENVIMKDAEYPDFNRVFLTYSSERNERFYGFGEQFSHMDFKGKRVPIFVQEQGIGRGDQPITFAANLVSYRAGGDWSTTYAPSPFYITSKMKSLYLEGYNYSVFDLTRHDTVQIQMHGDYVQGRILHGESPLELVEIFTKAIGRPPELPEWIISGAVVGMQGGTDFVRDVWDKLRAYNVPISAFWLQVMLVSVWVRRRKTQKRHWFSL